MKTQKNYKITLFRENDKNNTYILTEKGFSEEDAIEKAKRIIATIGWWGILETKPIEERMKRIKVLSCVVD